MEKKRKQVLLDELEIHLKGKKIILIKKLWKSWIHSVGPLNSS